MFKKGFTLHELLITMAIIGVIATITIPSLVGMAPNKTKSMYMKAFNTLSNVTSDILNDETLYWTTYETSGTNVGDAACSGLYCDAEPTEYPKCNSSWTCLGTTKFASIFATKVNVISKEKYSSSTVKFTTNDGINWEMQTTISYDSHLPGNRAYKIAVTINVKPDDFNNNCTFSTSCKNPQKFTFDIANDGEITPTDALGIVYSQNPIDMHSANEDREYAEKIVGRNDMAKALYDLKKKNAFKK